MKKNCLLLLAGAIYAQMMVVAPAADLAKTTPEIRDWAFQISPYGWMTGLKGELSPFRRAPIVAVDKDFSDVLKDLDFAGFVDFYYRQDKLVVSGDLMYVNTTDAKAFGPKHFDASVIGLPLGFDLSNAKIKVDSQIFNSTLTAGYRVIDEPDISLDLLGGVRLWHISNTVTVGADVASGGMPIAGGSVSLSKSFGWVDPLIAARSMIKVTDKVSLLFNADIGGFGVGSKLNWQALGTVNYSFNAHWTASLGYKHMAVEYNHNGHVFDTKLSGPVMAVTYRF